MAKTKVLHLSFCSVYLFLNKIQPQECVCDMGKRLYILKSITSQTPNGISYILGSKMI